MGYNWKKVVAADLFDDEYIIANLNTGLYYSVQGTIINVLQCFPFESIDKKIEDFGEKITLVNKKKIMEVWDELISEELIDLNHPEGLLPAVDKEFIETEKKCNLSKYADMQDLLALDPIHEVDEKGWPEINATEE